MQEENQDLNEQNLQEFQEEVSNYLTDSDIDDPKYLPTLPKTNYDQPQYVHENITIPLQERIQSLKNDSVMKNKSLIEQDNENNLLRTEIFKLNEALHAKDIVIEEFQNLANLTKTKFNQFEDTNKNLKNDNERLIHRIEDLEREIKQNKSLIDQSDFNNKNIRLLEEHINEIQNDFAQKEMKMNKRYQEKETSMRTEYLNEITKISKELEDLRIEKDKTKYDLSTHKVKVEELVAQLEDKEYEYSSEITSKTKENAKLIEQIKELNEKMTQMEMSLKQKLSSIETSLQVTKDSEQTLAEDNRTKEEQLMELEGNLKNAEHEIEMMTHEFKEINSKCDNKDIIIDQLKNQNNELLKELACREEEMILYDQAKQKEFNDYNEQLNSVFHEKNEIEAQNSELIDNLSQANEQLKKMNDLFTDKYSTMEMSLYKEATKNDNIERKYKGLLKQLKHKEKSLYEENKNLKEHLSQKDYEKEQMDYQYQNDMKNLSFYNSHNLGYQCNTTSPMIYNTKQMNNSMSIANNNYQCDQHSRYEDSKEEGQKRTLEEFKRLLSKIDDKLDLPLTHN